MRNLISFIWKNNIVILFLILEIICFYFILSKTKYQRASLVNSSNELSASVLSISSSIKNYFYLKDENEKLAAENAELRSKILSSLSIVSNVAYVKKDTSIHQKFTYSSAKVVNNSTNLRNNYLTLNKGWKQGVKKDMAVISASGVVGQVKDVSENFCTVMSLLHSRTIISSKIKKDGSYGPLTWDSDDDYNTATLHDIPTHVRLMKGDSIVTSPYSLTFPENIMIGTVESFERKSGEYFYTIKVRLNTYFKKLNLVYIVTNIYKEEQEALEKQTTNDSKIN
jgi:rod shape-determining protein MreC